MLLSTGPVLQRPAPDGRVTAGRDSSPVVTNIQFHEAILYFGYVATLVPCVLAIEAGIRRRLDRSWIAAARRWLLGSWFLLTIGITYGMWRAYGHLGWGNQWLGDSVANGSLFPWLAESILLTSLTVYERSGTRHDGVLTISGLFGLCVVAFGALLLVCAVAG